MARKIYLALAASAVAIAMSSAAGAEGPGWGTSATSSYDNSAVTMEVADGACFPAAISECVLNGPVAGGDVQPPAVSPSP